MNYHIIKDGQTEGPMTDVEFHRRVMDNRLGPDDLVWSEGWEEWKTLRDAGLIRAEPAPPAPEVESPESLLMAAAPVADTPRGILFRIKPPFWTAAFLLIGVLLNYTHPILRFPGWGHPGLAVLLGVGSLMLFVWSVSQFLYKDTPLNPGTRSTVLITDGPYRYSRNPIYLAMIGLTAAFAAGFGTLPTLLAPVGLYFVLARIFIATEESLLQEQFGDDYQTYCQQVHRWFSLPKKTTVAPSEP